MSDFFTDDEAALIEDAREFGREKRKENNELLEAVADDYKAPVAETTVTVGDENPVSLEIEQRLHGDFIDRMENIEARVNKYEDDPEEYEGRLIGDTAEDAAELLDQMTVDPGQSKEKFYQVYRVEGLDALGMFLEAAGEGIRREIERQEGEVDGFR